MRILVLNKIYFVYKVKLRKGECHLRVHKNVTCSSYIGTLHLCKYYFYIGHRVHTIPLQHRRLYILQSPQARRTWPSASLRPEPNLQPSLQIFYQGKVLLHGMVLSRHDQHIQSYLLKHAFHPAETLASLQGAMVVKWLNSWLKGSRVQTTVLPLEFQRLGIFCFQVIIWLKDC